MKKELPEQPKDFASIAPQPTPWWNKTGLVTIVAAIVAAIAPVTTGVKGFFELKVEREENLFNMRDSYLEKAIDKQRSSEDQKRLFEFLVVVFKDDPLQEWAEQQLKDASEQLKLELEATRKEKQLVEENLQHALSHNETLEINVTELKRKISEKEQQVENLKNNLAIAEKVNNLTTVSVPNYDDLGTVPMQRVFTDTKNAVVRINTEETILSGFFVSSQGHILTAAHGFAHEVQVPKITVNMLSNIILEAELVAMNQKLDLALLKVAEPPSGYLKFSSRNKLLGSDVVTAGYLRGLELVPAYGKVQRVSASALLYSRVNRTVMPGTAGGPVLNDEAKVIGMHHASKREAPDSWIAVAIPASTIKDFLKTHL